MKIYIYTSLIILSILFVNQLKCQTLTDEDKQRIIAYLDTSDITINYNAIDSIRKFMINEAIQPLEDKIWTKCGVTQVEIMRALVELGSTNIHSIALKMIDSASVYSRREGEVLDSLLIRVYATDALIKLQDYSTAHYMLEMLKRNISRRYAHTTALFSLKTIMENVPTLADSVKSILIDVLKKDTDRYNRIYSMNLLVEKYGSEEIPLLLELGQYDSSGEIRYQSLRTLARLGYSEIRNLRRQRFILDDDGTLRSLIANSLLQKYGTPLDYKIVKENVSFVTDNLSKELIDYALEQFIPLKPDSLANIVEIIDSLEVVKEEVHEYSWIADNEFVNELDSNLTSAQNYLSQGDSINCARQIFTFQKKVNEEYRDSLDGDSKFVTIEGWKFLYYNAQYILDRLPTPPPQYNLNINIIGSGTVSKNPDLAMYDSSTTVQLTATPLTGYNFTGWSGDVNNPDNPLILVMNDNKNITATFTIKTYTINSTVGSNGTITPSGTVIVNHGSNRTFTITPSEGYHTDSVFVNGNYIGAVGSYTFTNVTSNQTIYAKFKINTYTLTIQPNPNGVVTKNPDQTVYNHGVAVQLTATPNTGYEFVGWGGDLEQYNDNPITLEMNSDKNISVYYEPVAIQLPTFTLNVTIVGSGTVTKTPNQPTYELGTSVILSAKPASGFRFVGWSGDATGTSTKITISMNGNKNIIATFVR